MANANDNENFKPGSGTQGSSGNSVWNSQRIAGEISGTLPLKRAFNSFKRINSDFVRSSWETLSEPFRPWKQIFSIPSEYVSDKDRFEYALHVSGNAGNIDKIQASAARRAQFMAIAMICMTAIGVAGLKKDGLVYNIIVGNHGGQIALALPFILLLPLLSKYIQWSFWSFQLRERRLASFFEFLKKPSQWLPPDMPGGRLAGFLLMAAAGGALAQHTGLGIDRAMAQAVNQGGQTLESLSGQAGTVGSVTGSSVMQSLMGNLSNGDLSMQWLTNLFPSIFSSASGVSYGQDAVAQMLETVNITLIGIGSVLMMWHAVSGVVSTAHEGQVLGKKYHTVWAPSRILMGIAGTVPIKGYCAAQLLALQIIVSGCGLANLAWMTYVDAATGATNQIVSVTLPPQSMDQVDLFNAVLEKSICVTDSRYVFLPPSDHNPPVSIQQVQQETASSATGGVPVFEDPSQGSGNNVSGINQVWNFGAACGSIAYPAPGSVVVSATPGSTGFNAHVATQSSTQVSTTLTNSGSAFVNARNQAFNKFVGQVMSSNYVSDLASSYSAGGSTQTNNLASELAALKTDYTQYENTVLTAAQKYQGQVNKASLTAIAQQAVALGWASAGALEPQILQVNIAVDSMIDQKPSITNGAIGLPGSKTFKDLYNTTVAQNNSLENILMYAMPNLGVGAAAPTSKSPGNGTLDSQKQLIGAIKGSPSDIMNYVGQYSGSYLERYANNATNVDPLNPIAEISSDGEAVKGVGYSLLTLYYGMRGTARTVLTGAKATQSASSDAPVVGEFASIPAGIVRTVAAGILEALKAVAMIFESFCFWLIIIGAIMEYIIPMIGYLMWISAILVYMVFVVELAIGSAFWAFAHIRADGDELVGREQGFGYSALMIALFYPVLMVIGLIFANVAITAMFQFINETFLMGTSVVGAVYDPFGIAIILSVKLYLYLQIIIRAYRLISAVPDYVFQYIGASARRDDSFGHASKDVGESIGQPQKLGGRMRQFTSNFGRGGGAPGGGSIAGGGGSGGLGGGGSIGGSPTSSNS